MYVCLCQGITDRQIEEALDQGAQGYKGVQKTLGVATQCGSCSSQVKDIVKTYQKQQVAFYNAAAVA